MFLFKTEISYRNRRNLITYTPLEPYVIKTHRWAFENSSQFVKPKLAFGASGVPFVFL